MAIRAPDGANKECYFFKEINKCVIGAKKQCKYGDNVYVDAGDGVARVGRKGFNSGENFW